MKKQFRIINKGKGQLVLSTANLEEVADPSDIVVYIDEQVETRQPKVAGKSLVLDTEITKLINLDNTKDIDKAVSTPQENRIQEVVGAQITNSTALTDPTIAIVPTGNVHILGVGPGTYTYWGNQTVPANNIATLRRIGGVFSMSLTPITIPTSKSEAWTNVAGYATDVDRTHLGKLWKSNAATATTDIPGTSSKWVEVLTAYNKDFTNINLVPNANLGLENIVLVNSQSSSNHTWWTQSGTPTLQLLSNFEGFDKVAKFNLKVGDRVNFHTQRIALNASVINNSDIISIGVWVKVPASYTGTVQLNLNRTGATINNNAIDNEYVQFSNDWRFYRLKWSYSLSTVTDNLVWIYLTLNNTAGSVVNDIHVSNPVMLKTNNLGLKIDAGLYKPLDSYQAPTPYLEGSDVINSLSSTEIALPGSANNDRVINDKIVDTFDLLDITSNIITLINSNILIDVTTTKFVTNLTANKRYTITAQSNDALPSGLDFYKQEGVTLTIIKEFEPTENFVTGVSFEFTPTVDCQLLARTYVSGKNVVFTVTRVELVTPLADLLPIVTDTKVVEHLNFIPYLTSNILSSDFKKYAGKTLRGKITAQYNGRFTVYGTVNSVLTVLYDKTADFTTPLDFSFDVPLNTTEISFRFYQTTSVINNVTIYNSEITPNYLPFGSNQWNNKLIAFYGDSITAISNGDFIAPIQTSVGFTIWGMLVGKYLNLSKVFGRGIGSQKYAFGTNGGSVAFINADGNLHSRNDAYNYDNYVGNVAVPSGTIPVRGAYSSWLRIKTMFPASIKNTIDAVVVMGGTNDAVDATALAWVPSSIVDTEWAASTEYATYGGDYNLNTLEGGIASTIMKFQAWMPNTRFIIATPLSGRGTTGQLNLSTPITEEYTKSISIKKVADIFSIPVININSETGINGINRNIYIDDTVHPYNMAGNRALAMGFLGGLRRIFPRLL